MALENVDLENIRVLYGQSSPNFSGRELRYNKAGDRNVCLLLPMDIAERMGKLGWNVKFPKDPESGQLPFIQVSTNFNCSPRLRPKIHMITGSNDIFLTEDNLHLLDEANILYVDVTLRDREWEPGRHKAYVDTMYAVVQENRFAEKYRNRTMPRDGEDVI